MLYTKNNILGETISNKNFVEISSNDDFKLIKEESFKGKINIDLKR